MRPMNLFKLTPVIAIATLLSACGVLEWNTPTAGGNGPLFSPSPSSNGGTNDGAGNDGAANSSAGSRTTLASGAGATGTPMNGQVKQIFETERCNDLSRGGFIWFTEEFVLDNWLAPLGPDLVAQVKSQVDFSKQGALLVDYGVAGSTGAGVELLSDRLIKRGKEAVFQIKKNKASSKDRKTTQMVTHPCYVFVMPRLGFDELVIQSEQGDRLTSFKN